MAAADDTGNPDELVAMIAEIYSGPLDAFVSRRDALARELRAAGRREDARTVKALRKPKRLAWALNVASIRDPAAVEEVAVSVAVTLEAHSGRGDLRASLRQLRDSTEHLAAVASSYADANAQSIDVAELAHAVTAVIGTRDAFDLLRSGRLVDIPEAGSLDVLTGTLPALEARESVTAATPAPDPDVPDPEAVAELQRAEESLANCRKRKAQAERALKEAEANAEVAERDLTAAQAEARARREEVGRARNQVEAATADALEAERAVIEARRQVHAK